ncbi:MAG: glycosyltransferase [Pseudomonadota bacterium]
MKTVSNLPKVSVAVVTYNQCELLRECLDAILAQDYPNIEIVVADDASPDATPQLIAEYHARHGAKIVPVIAAKNGGVTVNQQAALDACTGDYIAWMAGDDLMLPGKITTQVAYMESHPNCAIVYHDLEIFNSDSGKTLGHFSDVDKPRSGTISTLVRHGSFNGATSNMVRASKSPPHGFEPSIRVASDWLYYVECLSGGGTIDYIDKVLGKYRRHEDNVTKPDKHNPQMNLLKDHVTSCEILLAKHPEIRRDVNYRMGYLMAFARLRDGGVAYNDCLKSSLSYRFSPKILLALIANMLFGIKR